MSSGTNSASASPHATPDTIRLYYDDAQLARFSASVTEIAGEGRIVYLDRTAFYPTSGGQPHDLGTIAEVSVVDVVDEESRIAHHLAEPLGLPAGAMVVGQIDVARRIDHMQQHTGQHLLSALLTDEYGWPTVSVHFGDESSTVDVAGEGLTLELLATIEQRVNTLALENHAVSVSYEDASTAEGLRKASDRAGTLRIVTIEGLDRSACGGTHVARTAEIGAMLLRRYEKTRGNSRIEFICGHRAVQRARLDADLLTRAARPLSAAPHDLPALVEQQQSRLVELERERKASPLRARRLRSAGALAVCAARCERRAAGAARHHGRPQRGRAAGAAAHRAGRLRRAGEQRRHRWRALRDRGRYRPRCRPTAQGRPAERRRTRRWCAQSRAGRRGRPRLSPLARPHPWLSRLTHDHRPPRCSTNTRPTR
ncbi:alanyl-tRNA editing protein [Gemmatimonas sp.]|uniref:alanyl-tRNA editing protein n=1 Tax=Gemmatimonas sp. TaxID=1962908 RepID=UPI003DA2C472